MTTIQQSIQHSPATDSFRALGLRDLLIAALTVGLWISGWPDGPVSGVGIWLLGLLTVYCGFSLHEWGHVLGARLSGATIYPARSLLAPFLYNFDAQANLPRQFLATSVTGFAATGLFVAVYLWMLPDTGAGLIAQRGALLLATLTVVFEFPIAIAVAFGKAVPDLRLFADQRGNPTSSTPASQKEFTHD